MPRDSTITTAIQLFKDAMYSTTAYKIFYNSKVDIFRFAAIN